MKEFEARPGFERALRRALDLAEQARGRSKFQESELEVPEVKEPIEHLSDEAKAFVSLLNLEALGWSLINLWIDAQISIDGDLVQVLEILNEKAQERFDMHKERLGR